MSDRKPFITLGRTKIEKFFGALILIYIVYKVLSVNGVIPNPEEVVKNNATAAFHEVTIPSKWFDDYSVKRMETLVGEFKATKTFQEINSSINKLPSKPTVSIEAYQDDVEGEPNLGWVIRFTAQTPTPNYTENQEVASRIGQAFVSFIEKYRK